MGSARSYPPAQAHHVTTLNTTPRARTEPLPGAGGFMRSVMRHHDMDDMDGGIMVIPRPEPERQITQEEQDALDEKARKRAMKNLVNSWQERLQLISVITTFFASTEAAMLVNTKPITRNEWDSGALKASNACLLGALIVHVYAAILSFLGAFFLIRYKLKEATREEMIAEGIRLVSSPLGGSVLSKDVERDPAGAQPNAMNHDGEQSTLHHSVHHGATGPASGPRLRKGSYPIEPPIISADPHIEQVGPFMSTVSSHLLSRTHALCVLLTAIGFVLAIVGVLCYAWASQPREVSIFASLCMGGIVLAMVVLLV